MAHSLDEAAFTSFYARSSRALWSYVYRVTGNAGDADDITQEAFLRLLRADLETPDEEVWRRYLYRVASNLIIDRWRRVKRESGEESVVEGSTPGGRFEQDADIVMFIFREEVYKQDDPELQGRAEIIIGKQRNGPTGKLHLAFLKSCTRFESLADGGLPPED